MATLAQIVFALVGDDEALQQRAKDAVETQFAEHFFSIHNEHNRRKLVRDSESDLVCRLG